MNIDIWECLFNYTSIVNDSDPFVTLFKLLRVENFTLLSENKFKSIRILML